MNRCYQLATRLLAHAGFARANTILCRIALHGLGVMNADDRLSGERGLVQRYFRFRQSPVLVDVGANVGDFSRLFWRSNPDAAVVAVEPSPGNFSHLSRLEGIKAHRLALGAQTGTMRLYDQPGVDGSTFASLYADVFTDLHKTRPDSSQVECTTLDRFCKENAISEIDLLKLDTEGNEYQILAGAADLLRARRIQFILFEFNQMNVISRVFMRDFSALLDGYKLYRLLPSGLLPVPAEPLMAELFAYQNILAVLEPEERP